MTRRWSLHHFTTPLSILAVVLSLGCLDQALTKHETQIEVLWPDGYGYPDVVDFGSVATGVYDEVRVTVSNVGDSHLEIHDVRLAEEFAMLSEDGVASPLEAGQGMEVLLRFAPATNGEWTNTLLIDNSVTEEPIEVPIVMAATGDPVPDIFADPEQHNFLDVQIHSEVIQSFNVGNTGFSTLAVGQSTLDTTTPEIWEISYDTVSNQAFEVGDQPGIITVTFRPTAIQSYSADVVIPSNDPDEDPLRIPVWGNGWEQGGDGPVAVCSVNPNPIHPIVEMATWIGNASYDPDGYIPLTYDWTLVSAPPGSAASMNPMCGSNNPDCNNFFVDMTGTYTAQLTVTNSIGMSGSCTVDLEAIPPAGLWVEMYWTLLADDMDLHMLATNGVPWSITDCHYLNCIGGWFTLDWGMTGDTSDNPSLDLDDIPGTGPENINIPNPEPNGIYSVFVHDYTGSNQPGDPPDANDTTVNVYMNAQLVWSDTRPISGDGDEVPYCSIDWAAGTVTAL